MRSSACPSTSEKYWFGALRKMALLRRKPSTRCSTSEPFMPRTITALWPGVVCCTKAPVAPRSCSIAVLAAPGMSARSITVTAPGTLAASSGVKVALT
ncbi:MAG: hypothetical protein IPG63_03370 [Xanthomonadales bacterium]|nr:hypothetical protein [Xanthomonadales bacterium]